MKRKGRVKEASVRWESGVGMFSQIARINDHLYLSSLEAMTPLRLQVHGISQVISAMVEPLPTDLLKKGEGDNMRCHVQVCVEDKETANLSAHFDAVADRIAREARRGGRTLVHCIAGVSRSPSLVLAYLVKHGRMSLADAYHHVRGLRPCIRPNVGFWQQLIDYEVAQRGVPTMRVEPSTPPTKKKSYLATTSITPRYRHG